jgi:hypothetical protein
MPISDDWDFDYPNTTLQHVDGVLSYDTGTSGQAVVGDYIRGDTSGALGKVIAVTGSAATGTYTFTVVEGLFEDNEPISLMSNVNFDAVTNGGFAVGDTLTDQVTGTILVRAIEYNRDGVGGGTIYGDAMVVFTNDSALDITGGVSAVALADGVGVDNDAVIDTALVAGTLAIPGTAATNDSVLIHYDAGAVNIPEQAIVLDASTAAIGLVEQVFGVLDTGSLRIVDYDSTGGVWVNNNSLELDQVLLTQNQVAGQVFSVGDVVVGVSSGATGRVIGLSGLNLIFADESGTWTTLEDLNVDSVKIAEADGTNITLAAATLNILEGIRTEQRTTSVGGGVQQGGIYDAGDSLNIVRKLNSLYTLSQDTFDELLQMDDDEAMDAAFKGFAYSLVFSWRVESNSQASGTKFLRQGALIDTSGAEVWANPQSLGAQNKITDEAYLIDTTQTFRQPQLYIEQNGAKVVPWWLEGNIDVLLLVKTRQDTRFIDGTTPGLGQLITGGDPAVDGGYAVFNREFYTSTYDATEVDGAAGVVNSVALGTADDTASDRNPNGTHIIDYELGSGATLLVGEEIVITPTGGNDQKVGLVVAQTGDGGAVGTVEYVLKSGTQFIDADVLVGSISTKSIQVDEPVGIGDSVAGFGADIRLQVVDIAATPSGGTGITGLFVPGDLVTQAVTSATAYLVLADTTTNILYLEIVSGTFSGDNDITGSVTGSWDAGTGATYPSDVDFPADLNNGEGAFQYTGTVGADITDANARSIQSVYEWTKYITRQEEETLIIEGGGTADDGTVGNLFRRLDDTFSEVKPGAPIGTFTGSLAFAQGWFLDTAFLLPADIRSFSLRDNTGTLHNPPNLQALTVTGVATGWRVAVYRAASGGSTVIQRTEFDVGAIGSGNNEAADVTVLVGAQDRSISPLPPDVPDSGVLRILSPSGSNNSGNYIPMIYSSVDRDTNIFTLADTIGTNLTNAGEASVPLTLDDNVHVVFIEEEASGTSVSTTIQYDSDINLIVKARLKGFKPFRTTGTFGTGGATVGVVQTADTIVDLP